MNPILSILVKYKSARYGSILAAGVIMGLWLGNEYPAENAKLWAMPAVSLAFALAGVIGGAGATKDWKAKVEEALMTTPPDTVSKDRP